MATIDIKALLNRLDATARSALERASRFCVQQQHPEVAVEHYLLQMLDDNNNPLTQLLARSAIDRVVWIKQLLAHISRNKKRASGNPVFSDDLLTWFTEAGAVASQREAASPIGISDLIVSLLDHPSMARDLALTDLDRLSVSDIDAGAPPDMQPDASSDAATPTDSTMVLTPAELAAATSAPSPNPTEATPQIAGYGDLSKIGEGGMARVYRATHLGLEREVALKVLLPGMGVDEEFIGRFMREARIVAKLTHRNIIQIYDVNRVDELTYLAMEFVSGGELSDRMLGKFTFDETVSILAQVLEALQFAHDKGFIHRDIKPANILFRADGSVALTDFGIARAIGEDSGLTIAGSVLGTPRYMSPEQAKGDPVDHRADLYAVGVLFYQMLEGKLPYIGDSAMGTAMKHILDPIPTLSAAWAPCQPIIDRAMAKAAEDRFGSGREMVKALRSVALDHADI